MKKAKLISAIAEKSNESKATVEAVLTSLADVVVENVKDGDISIPKFGTFKQRINKAREGINPATKEKIQIKESCGLAFKQSSKVKEILNG